MEERVGVPTPQSVLASRISGALKSLGDTADEVAQSLRDKGIKGYVGSSGGCPIARFIRALNPEWVVMVGSRIRIYGIPAANTPRPVADFIARFDRRGYPDLIDELFSKEGFTHG